MTADQTVRRHERVWVERAGRLGYATKGIVYIIIAYLALHAAMGAARAEDSRGALRSLRDERFGGVMLVAIGIGLLFHALWRGYLGITDPENDNARKRIGSVFIAGLNAALSVEAFRMAGLFGGGSGSDNQAQHWTAVAMSKPFGVWAVGLTALGIAGYGIGRMYRAYIAKLDDQLRLGELDARTRVWVRRVCRFGIAARGVAFVLIGVFLLQAALHANPAEAKDLGESLQELQRQPFGPILLAVVATGLFAYGVYELVRARYRLFRAA